MAARPPRQLDLYHIFNNKLAIMQEFHPFSRLPPELRREIWLLALQEWSAITVRASKSSYELLPFGWDKSSVGRVCYEARLIMEKMYTKHSQTLDHNIDLWIHFESTTLFLGAAALAIDVVGRFDTRLCSNLTYISIIWSSWQEIVACFKKLSLICHSLKSIVIFDAGKPTIQNVQSLAAESRARAASLHKSRPDYEPWWADAFVLTADLQGWVSHGSSPPTVTFLPL
ncbi:hypothetical protein GGR52DRAFT_53131 [Hypoxylon sp. FL1284]|nr:hypothetical protein GGR52DRAFT_53131 [Hypoxylon sp. FL1284]